jgi:CTP synthase (UTP-ammonia lyase)
MKLYFQNFGIETNATVELKEWKKPFGQILYPQKTINIAALANMLLQDAYKSIK